MRRRFFAFEVAAAAVLLPGFLVMPAIAANPSIPDNSGSDAAANLQPADAGTPTAPARDIDDSRVTAQIRAALASDRSLSTQAQNVTIATNPEAVTLRGSVKAAEKDRIVTLAGQFAGTRQIVDQLLVLDR